MLRWRSNYPSKKINLKAEMTMEPDAESNFTPAEKTA